MTAAHAYIAVPQCNYRLTAVDGREDQYFAEVTVRPGLTYQGVLLTVPETTEPSVLDETCAFTIDSFKALMPYKQKQLIDEYSILEPLLVKSKHMVPLNYYCKSCGI